MRRILREWLTYAMHCVGTRKICQGKEERGNSVGGY